MNKVPLWIALVFCAVGVHGQDEKPVQPRDRSAKRELQGIQGTWQVTSLRENGEKVPDADLKGRTIFFGGEAFLVRQGELPVQLGSQKLDPSKKPKTINAMVAQGDRKGDILLGIYELNGDTLKVCFDTEGQKRPREFNSEPGSGAILAVYTPMRGGDDPRPNVVGEYTSVTLATEETAEVGIEKLGDAYTVTWRRNKATVSSGVGVRRGDTFSVSWATQGQTGIVVYQIEKDGKLIGKYAPMGSIGLLVDEHLTPKKQID